MRLANYISGYTKTLDLKAPDLSVEHIDFELKDNILTMTPERSKAKKINKSTLWYEKKMLSRGKAIKIYNEVRVKKMIKERILSSKFVWRLSGVSYRTAVIATHGFYVPKGRYLEET
ncbi:MAG: hypothetical protein QXU98_13550, partial [Candidatus Parvarchaeota archaeon]